MAYKVKVLESAEVMLMLANYSLYLNWLVLDLHVLVSEDSLKLLFFLGWHCHFPYGF